jgi:predicted HTH domain antitoxin
MQLTVELPDELAGQIIPAGSDPSRVAIESLALEAYRAHRLSEHQLARLLGMGRYELDGWLKQRGVWLEYGAGEMERELTSARSLAMRHRNESDATISST